MADDEGLMRDDNKDINEEYKKNTISISGQKVYDEYRRRKFPMCIGNFLVIVEALAKIGNILDKISHVISRNP